jgi:LemA protein
MTVPQIALLAGFGAVLLFWAVGAHNRLVTLRNAIGQAWTKVDEALRQRQAGAEPLLAALREPMAAEQGALDTWAAALAEAARAAAALGGKPVVAEHASAWVAAETTLAGAASRVFALLEQHAELRARDDIAASVAAWRDAGTRLGFARQLFNEAATAYNDAITTFPTRLLVRMFRFDAAGRL